MTVYRVRYFLYSKSWPGQIGIVHLSADGKVEDCATKAPILRESGGEVGNPKAEDLLASRLAKKEFRRCRKCFKYGPLYERR